MESTYGPGPPVNILPFHILNQAVLLCTQVEKIFRKSVEFCNEHDAWKLNVAHVLFMQENKYKEAAGFYDPIVKKNYDQVLFSVQFAPSLSAGRKQAKNLSPGGSFLSHDENTSVIAPFVLSLLFCFCTQHDSV